MKQRSRFYPKIQVDTAGASSVGHGGGVLLTETVAVTGLDRALSEALAPWRKPLAIHDPAKVVADLAVSLALGGDCLADVALLRAEPQVHGLVASDPTVSRTIAVLAEHPERALAAINAARMVGSSVCQLGKIFPGGGRSGLNRLWRVRIIFARASIVQRPLIHRVSRSKGQSSGTVKEEKWRFRSG